MKFVFKQAASFGFKAGDKEVYPLGLAEVSERVQSHPYFQKLLRLDLVVDAANAVEPETVDERNQRIAESLKSPKVKAKVKAEAEPVADAPVDSEKPVEADKKKKSRH